MSKLKDQLQTTPGSPVAASMDDFTLPKDWHVFGPIHEKTHIAPQFLISLPDRLKIEGTDLISKKVSIENGRLDLAPLLGGTAPGKTAYVYIPFTADTDKPVIFGFGADWWFEAYLDGTPLFDTLTYGNGNWPPTSKDHFKKVNLSKGRHLLVIRFISGTGSSVLCAQGSYDLKRILNLDPSQNQDGPKSPLFTPLAIHCDQALSAENAPGIVPDHIAGIVTRAQGECISWGIPFAVNKILYLKDMPVTVSLDPIKTKWLVFLHISEDLPFPCDENGFTSSPSKGMGQLGEPVARYVMSYADGSESEKVIRQRFEIGMIKTIWGDQGIECVPSMKPHPLPAHHESPTGPQQWGQTQTRVTTSGMKSSLAYVYAWANPHAEKPITAIRFEPLSVPVLVLAVTAGNVASHPLRWASRKKAVLILPDHATFVPELNAKGLLKQIQMDMGQIISACPRLQYDHSSWATLPSNSQPSVCPREILVEYTAHPEASFHLADGTRISAASIENNDPAIAIRPVAEALQRVTIRVIDKKSKKCVPVRIHIHGQDGEYLAPVDRHRIPNPLWFEDYSADYVNGYHYSTYISGETTVFLPQGKIFVEVTKGFEIKPVRKVIKITPSSKMIAIELEHVLPWRKKGWVTADTHVHFLSPQTALLEGEAEGVNVVNLLASQWGELMTNAGDFDGKSTWGSKEAGGSGEYLVRVGTENRQHILGHISLLGYEGPIIAPMTTGGPDESALGDPIFSTLTQWAEQCKKQKGLVIIPHFPGPRLENAATIVSGNVDGIELGGVPATISPYSLSDWYRYLNCGYMTAAVAGTDKMFATTTVGKIRTYAYIGKDKPFTYESWKAAVRNGLTFATTGPLMEFHVEGKMPGARLSMKSTGGTVSVSWEVASITVPMGGVELVCNGEIIHSSPVKPTAGNGHWEAAITRSSWLALRVRDSKDQIASHSSPVMVAVAGSAYDSAADAMTILDQIEGAIAYIDTIGTRAEIRRFKAMKLKLTSIYRSLHNRMHRKGVFHGHSPLDQHDHPDHQKRKDR